MVTAPSPVTIPYMSWWFALSFFFFSSRRRHTRLQGDWSSDVCSSDLEPRHPDVERDQAAPNGHRRGDPEKREPEPKPAGGLDRHERSAAQRSGGGCAPGDDDQGKIGRAHV